METQRGKSQDAVKEIGRTRSGGNGRNTMAASPRGGEEVKSQEEIAEVFACFYEDLCAPRIRGKDEESDKEEEESTAGTIEAITPEEVRGVLRAMARGKTRFKW